jgi:hypothetical protein
MIFWTGLPFVYGNVAQCVIHYDSTYLENTAYPVAEYKQGVLSCPMHRSLTIDPIVVRHRPIEILSWGKVMASVTKRER